MWEPNEKQKEALSFNFSESKKNLLIQAAAGSGKTRVLTERIINMLIYENISLRDILVMTFTVKATQEMKSRIKHRIDEELEKDIENHNLIRESSLIQNANITTIDSFCKSIVEKYYIVLNNSNSIYARFDPSYRIVDEKELSILYDDVLNNMLEESVYSDLEQYGKFLNCYFGKNGDRTLKNELLLKGISFLSSLPNPIGKLDEWIKNFDGDNENELVLYKLLKEFYLRIVDEKIRRNIYAISDYAVLAYEILNVENSTVAAELQKKYKYILIDEYQDTSIIQEEILSKIAKKNNLLMVGDVKQSIYGFRNAEPKIFLDKINEAKSEGNENHIVNMNTNYRSSEEIIGFVNDLFEVAMDENYDGMEFGGDCSDSKEQKVEVHILCDKKLYEKRMKISDEETKFSSHEIEAEFIARRIEELVKNGECEYKDIVILFRSLYSKVDTYVETFARHNIPVFSDMKKGFFDREEIKLMQDIFSVIDNERQDIPVASVLCSNVFGLLNNELAFIKLAGEIFAKGSKFIDSVKLSVNCLVDENNPNYKDYNKLIKNYKNIDTEELKNKLVSFVEKFDSLRLKARYYSISELIDEIYDTLDIKNIMLSMNDGIMRVANLDVLRDLAKGYENASYVGLFNFLRYIEKIKTLKDDQGLAKVFDENNNVVRIMTIHTSKGLEFNYVFVAGCMSAYNKRDTYKSIKMQTDTNLGIALDHIDVDKNYTIQSKKKIAINELKSQNINNEEMRMLYVALTRAKKKLIITGAVNGKIESFKKGFLCTDEDYKKNPIDKCNSYMELILTAIREDCKFCDISRDIVELDETDSDNTYRLTMDKILEEIIDDDIKGDNTGIVYHYEDYKKIKKSKFSVTEIKEQYNTKAHAEYEIKEVESFDVERKDSTNIGNSYHKYMQFYTYEEIKSGDELISKSKLMNNANNINVVSDISYEKINKFLSTSLGSRMAAAYKSKNLFREYKFMKLFSKKDIDSYSVDDIDENRISKEIYEDRSIVIQGIIDAFFVENGKIIVVDYKTDLLKKENVKEEYFIDKYKVQLDIYAKSIEELTKMNVAEKYIYSFALDKEILLP